MARIAQNVLVVVSLVMASLSSIMLFATAQEIDVIVYEPATSPTSYEFGYEVYEEVIDPVDIIADDGAQSPTSSPPEPSPGYYKQLDECAKRIPAICAGDMYEALFRSGVLPKNCCKLVVSMGYECHILSTKFSLSEDPELKPKASEALHKAVQIWKTCVNDVETDQSAAPSPF